MTTAETTRTGYVGRGQTLHILRPHIRDTGKWSPLCGADQNRSQIRIDPRNSPATCGRCLRKL